MITKNDSGIVNCFHVVFDPWRDAGTGMTSEAQRSWLESTKAKVMEIITEKIASEDCFVFRDGYQIIEGDLGKTAAPRIIVLHVQDGIEEFGKKQTREDCSEAATDIRSIVDAIDGLSAYVYCTAQIKPADAERAAELADV